MRTLSILLGACVLSAAASTARALPPLVEFVGAAREQNVDNREASHRAAQAHHEAAAAAGALLPYATAQARYQRNQYQVEFKFGTVPFNVAPLNQYDVVFTAGAPIIDAVGWARRDAAEKSADAARVGSEATALDVERGVVTAYYRFAAALAVVEAANAARDAARENLRIAEAQRSTGTVPALDVQRATAEFAAAEEGVANAELNRELARRELASLTGLEPDDQSGAVIPDAELKEEEPLESWQARAGGTPAVRSAAEKVRAGEAQSRAAKLALVPTIEATAQERFTNATAFTRGHSPFYTIMGTANWRFDFTDAPRLRAQQEAAATARTQAERARITAADSVHQAWWTVHASIAQVRAANARAEAARAALGSARMRYEAGAGTQFDALQAVRDAAEASVASIQANANLAAARALLRLSVGESLAKAPARQ